ncbi:acylglycerol kinase, mitochondrial [Fopius arisanus]|uniref:Acylglycerol kinase, mitochondrial n=1 Tax=Fopius arisanus TaxID=64838 RepID=A0A9R1T0I0_9HYME|nr:PREDICTED: acylglycerol kinase, mitochondrial [Fopius arisanus]
MARIVNLFKNIRNNWKKSLFGAAILTYGTSYGLDVYQTNLLMRAYCEEAVKFGNEPLPPARKPRHITIILNPTAKKRKAKKLFEKYCEPLLHLAGIAVTIIQTEQEGHARSLIENMNTATDAILVAGGDGTLLDVVTGLMRKYEGNRAYAKQCPIGILPLGETNRIADTMFLRGYENHRIIHEMADATMAAVKGETKMVDVVKVEPLNNDPENVIRPIYAVGAVEWGAWRDAHARKDKYWYWGSLRRYMTYIFNGIKKDVNWEINGTLRYSEPCSGCSTCYDDNHSIERIEKRWWHVFIPRRTAYAKNEIDYSKVQNDKCGQYNEIPINATEISLITSNVKNPVKEGPPSVKLHLGPEYVSYTDFVSEGWRRIKGEKTLINKIVEAKDIELLPNTGDDSSDKQQYFSIDNEEFEMKPVKIKLLSKAVKMFSL